MATNLNDNRVWATNDEIRFFQRTTVKGMSKLEFLQNYKEGLCKRQNWQGFDKKRLFTELEKEITKEQHIQ